MVAEKAVSFYKKQGDTRQAAIFERAVSSVHYQRGEYNKAARIAKRSCRNLSDSYEKALAFILSGQSQTYAGKYKAAFNDFNEALEIAREYPGDVYLWTHLFGSRATAFERVGSYDSAIVDREGAATLLSDKGQYRRAAVFINNNGFLLIKRQCFEEAEDRLREALDLLRHEPHLHTEGVIRDSLGYLYTLTNRPNDAERFLEKSICIFERISDNSQLIGSLLHLSELRQRQLHFEEAHELALRSLDLATEIKSTSLIGEARERLKQVTLDKVVRTRTDSPVFSEILRVTSINSARPGLHRNED
ncbi:MAG: hypothetical protein DMF61_22440 [Blastocatellia bacterium AA13]|nr:MAG: hypothetical protein DMF61_22440 [Blastocatellia bacterium AA13]